MLDIIQHFVYLLLIIVNNNRKRKNDEYIKLQNKKSKIENI